MVLLVVASASPLARAQSTTPEVEPNATPATATPLTLSSGFAIAGGAISPAGDQDYYSFVAPPGSKAWIFADTGGTNGTDLDSFLTLFAGNGTTVIEEDDDDGTGNGCDSTKESELASAIGGRTLVAGGTYYVRVSEFADDEVVNAYKLFLVVTTTTPTSEVESNGTPALANPILTSASTIGLRSGSIGAAGDMDLFSVAALAGNTLYINADCDPERDGTGTDLGVELISTNGTAVLFAADSSTTNSAAAEAFCFTVPVTGTYYLRVKHATGGMGNYHLMVASIGPGTLQFSAGTYVQLEGSGNATIPVIRTSGSIGTVTVRFATSNGTATASADYAPVSQVLTFADGVTTQFVSVVITNDALIESNETVLLTLSMPTGGASLGTPNPAVLVILDDDEIPDNSPGTAAPLDLSSGLAVVATAASSIPLDIAPGGDEDWFSFTAPPGSTVWAFVDSGGAQNPEATSRDTVLTLFAGDGTTVIEEDDDDGSGSGCGPALPSEGGLDSAIAGRTLVTGGTYYLRIKAFSSLEIISPYTLFVELSTSSPLSEVEPNNTPGFANALVTSASPTGQRLAQIGAAGEIDFYSVVAPSNCLLYVSADCDPERDGVGTDLVVDLLSIDGTTALFSADSSGAEPAAAEAFCLLLAAPGTYFIRVQHITGSETETGTYSLMASRRPAEVEPNDTPASAVPLDLFDQFARASGAIAPGSDSDYYSFVSPPGAKVWLTLDTGGPQNPDATSRNSVLTLLASDGATTIEADDNDGSGNGCDSTLESGDASAIAGLTLVTGGNYYARVSSSGGTGIINPYKLFAIVTTMAPTPEVEGNNTSGTANSIVAVAPAIGLRSGTIGAPGDADYYSVVAWAGNLLHISADGDPERDGVGTDLRVDLLSTNGSTVLFAANSAAAGSAANPAAEGFCYQFAVSGTYFVRVMHAGGGTGSYHLMVARDNTELRITALEQAAADMRISFTTQLGRNYQVLRSDSLNSPIPWTPLPGAVAGNGRIITSVDMGGTGQPRRFYQVRQVVLPLLAAEPPRLAFQRSGQNLVILWPTDAANFVLEASPSLPSAVWTLVTNTISVTNAFYQVSLPSTNGTRFFRLRQ